MKNEFFASYFLTFTILATVFKIDILIVETIMEGTVSQIFDLGPRFDFMKCRK